MALDLQRRTGRAVPALAGRAGRVRATAPDPALQLHAAARADLACAFSRPKARPPPGLR